MEYGDVVPYGLNTDGVWELAGMNKCLRINSYVAPSIGFKPHYDAAFCESDTVKSALSCIIYLNNQNCDAPHGSYYQLPIFEGGGTVFYDKMKKIDIGGLTVNEELKINGGLDSYDHIVVKPQTGKCIIFKQDLLHSALKVAKGIKYILRADVVYKKIRINKSLTIFDDCRYQKCVNYFKEAQYKELNEELIQSNELYERNISVRKTENNLYNDVWLYIFNFVEVCDKIQIMRVDKKMHALIISSKSIFWNDLYHASNRNMIDEYIINYNTQCEYNNNHTNLPFFVPRHIYRKGITNVFKYDEQYYKLFNENREAMLRVCVIFTIFLAGSTGINNTIFLAKYDPKTKSILKCNVLWLLLCAYYELSCYGSFYIVSNTESTFDSYDQEYNKDNLNEYTDDLRDVSGVLHYEREYDEPTHDTYGRIMVAKNKEIKYYAHRREKNYKSDGDNTEIKCDDGLSDSDNDIGDDKKEFLNAVIKPSILKSAKKYEKTPVVEYISRNEYIKKYMSKDKWNAVALVSRDRKSDIWKNSKQYAKECDHNFEFIKLFNNSVIMDDMDNHKNGFQVYNCNDIYEISESCDWGDHCRVHDSSNKTKRLIEHTSIKNNLIFNFATQKINIKICDTHKQYNTIKCYNANISNLQLEPYFHASCQESMQNYKFVKNKSSSFYKNKYIDTIHIKVTKMKNKEIYIETTYSCIASF
jgi:hypothetical protein